MKRKKSQFASEYERFMALSDEEKASEVAKFDVEFIADESRPLTAKEQREWQRIKRGPGRPKKGKGAEIVSVSVEKDLLNLADAYAKFKGISRSQLVGQGLRAVLSGKSVA